MTTHCPGSDLLLELTCELLEVDEATRLAGHLDDCLACQAQRDLLAGALEPPPEPPPPAEVLEALHRRIDEAEGRDQPSVPGEETQVRLLCTYCKDDLPKAEAIFCAGCLAPHHGDCFAEHGRCSIAGCESTRTVTGTEVAVAPPARRKLKAGLVIAFSAAVGGVFVAAVNEESGHRHGANRSRAAEEAAAKFREEAYDVADIVGAVRAEAGAVQRIREILAGPIPPLVSGARLREQLASLQVHTDLEIEVTAPMERRLDAEPTAPLREPSVEAFLRRVLRQVRGRMVFAQGRFRLEPQGSDAPRDKPLIDFSRERSEARTDPEGLLLLVRARCGPSWSPPARAVVEDGVLRVFQTERHQRAIRKLLRAISRGGVPGQPEPWSYPAVKVPPAASLSGPAQWRAKLVTQELALNTRRNAQLLSLAIRLGGEGVQVEVTPRAASLYRRARIALPLKGRYSVEAALETAFGCLSDAEGLTWEAGPAGVVFRCADERSMVERLACKPWRARLERVLRTPVDVQVYGDLPQVLEQLRKAVGYRFAVGEGLVLKTLPELQGSLRGSLGFSLDRLFKPHGLGLSLRQDGITIVRRSDADHDPAQVRSWLARRGVLGDQVGATVAGLIRRLGDVAVQVDPSAARCRARMLLPPDLTRGDLLELARLQGGVEFSLRFVGGAPVLTLFAAGKPPLQRAHELREEALEPNRVEHRPWIDPRLGRRIVELQRRFSSDFQALHARANTRATYLEVRRALERLFASEVRLRELREASRILAGGERELRKRLRRALLAQQSRWNEAVRAAIDLRGLDSALIDHELSEDPDLLRRLAPRDASGVSAIVEPAGTLAWRDELRRIAGSLGSEEGWSRAFPAGYAAAKEVVLRASSAQVYLGLVRQRRLGLSFDLEERRPTVVGVLTGRAAHAAGVAPGAVVTHVDGHPVGTRWELVRRLGVASGPAVVVRTYGEGASARIELPLDPRKPQGSKRSRR